MAKNRWKIHKFGGSSLADSDCFRRVASLMLERRDERIGVVVSAMGGMTDGLLNLVTHAERDDDRYEPELAAIGERYSTTAGELLDGKSRAGVLDAWSSDADDVRDVLKAIALVKSAPQRSRDVVAGYGEIWSARLLAAVLGSMDAERGGTWVDARTVMRSRSASSYCVRSRGSARSGGWARQRWCPPRLRTASRSVRSCVRTRPSQSGWSADMPTR